MVLLFYLQRSQKLSGSSVSHSRQTEPVPSAFNILFDFKTKVHIHNKARGVVEIKMCTEHPKNKSMSKVLRVCLKELNGQCGSNWSDKTKQTNKNHGTGL